MVEEIDLQIDKDRLRDNLSKYTRKAFAILPKLDKPRILDIGCGSGIPTMELARLSQGEIIGLDIDQPSLDKLTRKIEQAGLSHCVKTVNCSILNREFPDGSFDVIWAEGSIGAIGFERGLKEWWRFLKAGGFLVVHDDLENLTRKREQISQCGYELINHFVLSENIWWNEYYAPLDKKLIEIRVKHTSDQKTIAVLNDGQRDIDTFKRDPKRYRSVFFIMRKSAQIGEQ